MKTFTYTRTVPYSSGQMFDLIWDVERYPDFLPGWRHSHLLERKKDVLHVEQELSWGPIHVRFCSRVRGSRPRHIDITATEDPFRKLNIRWRFEAVNPMGCVIHLYIGSELRSAGLERMMKPIVKSLFCGVVSAFEERANLVYPRINELSGCGHLSNATSFH